MSYARAFSKIDTWITEYSTTANFGLTPVLEVWNKINDRRDDRKEWARMLVKFGLTSLSAGIVSTGKYPDPRTDSTVSAYIYMFNTPSTDTVPENFEIWNFPLTSNWIEGRGLDNDNFSNTVFANALSATNLVAWKTDSNAGQTGANNYLGYATKVYDSNSGADSFENGQENLKIEVTDYFKAFLNYATGTSIADGGSADHGFLLRMSDAQECKDATEATAAGVDVSVSAENFYSKKFYSRETNTQKSPYLQLEWPGAIKDDRKNIKFSKSGLLYYYSVVDGALTDLNGTGPFPGHVTLSADGNTTVAGSTGIYLGIAVTAGRHSKGIYKVNVGDAGTETAAAGLTGINIGVSSATSFTDSWTVTTAGEYRTDSFTFSCILPTSGHSNYTTANYQITLSNLVPKFQPGTTQRIRVNVKDRTTSLKSITGSSTAANNYTVKSGKIQIREKYTDDIEVNDFDISYDSEGNFFDLDTNLLYVGIPYKVYMQLDVRGDTFYYDFPDKWDFVVGESYSSEDTNPSSMAKRTRDANYDFGLL